MKTKIISNTKSFMTIVLISMPASFMIWGCTNKEEKDSYSESKEEFAKLLKTNDIAAAEKWLVQKIENDTIGKNTYLISCLLYDLINETPETMCHSFKGLKECGFLDVETSSDNNLKIYTWHDGTGNYNGGHHHIVQYWSDNKIHNIDFLEAYCPECAEEDGYDEFRGFELYTMLLNNQTYYMIEVGHFQAAGWLGCRDISIYTIENDKLVKQSLFKTSKEILSEIGFEYDAANYYYDFVQDNENLADWLFEYDDKNKVIYVPLVGTSESDFIVTDKYLLYQWDGRYFSYIGVREGMNRKV